MPAGVLAGLAGAAHTAGGYAGALGLLGVMGLLASVSWPGRDLIAGAGTWSMTLYLSQSVVFVAVFATVAGGLGSSASLTTATLIGLLVWLAGVLVAGLLARAGHRGPGRAGRPAADLPPGAGPAVAAGERSSPSSARSPMSRS